jgi:hypothetical protein
VKAHAASGESTAEVFARAKISLVMADIDKVNGGRAVNRQLKAKRVRIVKTPGNLRVFDQLGEICPTRTTSGSRPRWTRTRTGSAATTGRTCSATASRPGSAQPECPRNRST